MLSETGGEFEQYESPVEASFDFIVTGNRALRDRLREQLRTARARTERLGALTKQLAELSTQLIASSSELRHGIRACGPAEPVLVTITDDGARRFASDHAARAKEYLARLAAQLAGRHPDEKVRISFADFVAFDDFAWRYPDFVERAEKAYAELALYTKSEG